MKWWRRMVDTIMGGTPEATPPDPALGPRTVPSSEQLQERYLLDEISMKLAGVEATVRSLGVRAARTGRE